MSQFEEPLPFRSRHHDDAEPHFEKLRDEPKALALHDLVLQWAWTWFIVLVIAGLSVIFATFVVKFTMQMWS